jgi:hypothetical protein
MTTYELSRHAWVSVHYDQQIWIPCPFIFPKGADREVWARLYAGEWCRRGGLPEGGEEAAALAQVLSDIHKVAYSELPMHNGLIHLPSLTLAPLLVSLGVWELNGDRVTQLRDLAHADDQEAMEPPIVEEFSAERLGTGLKVRAYTRKRSTVTGHLNYAWRSDELKTALRVFTGSPDLGRLEMAIPDIERMLDRVELVPR